MVGRRGIRIRSSAGPAFDCHVVRPDVQRPVPALVLASTIRGVDDDVRAIAEAFACRGYLVAAPDLFWRTLAGPLPRNDPRATQRATPRLQRLQTGEQDLMDVLRTLRSDALCSGRAAVMGFCYGGPYAVIGPKRLGFDLGMACHGTSMLDFVDELDGERPVHVVWGDQDHAAPPSVVEAYRARAARFDNVAVHVLPGARHGYMMRGSAETFDEDAYERSMELAFTALEHLHEHPVERSTNP